MKVLSINNVNNNYKNSKMNARTNNQMTNSMNANVSFGGVFSTLQTNSCLNTAKEFFTLGNNSAGIKSFTEAMKTMFAHKSSMVDIFASLFSFKKHDILLATASAALLKLDDKSKENQEIKKDFMDTMFIQGDKKARNSVEDCVVDAFSKMDNKVYGDYKNSLLKTSFEMGNYYDARSIDGILNGANLSEEDKESLASLNKSRLDDEEREYFENAEPYIPQDPRYTP